jgi:hypothetical protein
MPQLSRADLKAKFVPGAKPTPQDFADLIDSFLLFSEQTAANAAIFNSALATYDNDLKAEAPNGVVDTVGDLFKVFQGINDGERLIDRIDALRANIRWRTIVEKPSIFSVEWSEQIIANYVYAPEILTAKWLVSELSGLPNTNKYMIIDMQIIRSYVPIAFTNAFNKADYIQAFRVAINPIIRYDI